MGLRLFLLQSNLRNYVVQRQNKIKCKCSHVFSLIWLLVRIAKFLPIFCVSDADAVGTWVVLARVIVIIILSGGFLHQEQEGEEEENEKVRLPVAPNSPASCQQQHVDVGADAHFSAATVTAGVSLIILSVMHSHAQCIQITCSVHIQYSPQFQGARTSLLRLVKKLVQQRQSLAEWRK